MTYSAERGSIPALPSGAERRYVHSVGTRLALATALIVLIVAVALYYVLIQHERQVQLQVKRDAAVMVARLFADLSSAPVLFGDDKGIRESLGYLRSNDEVAEAAVFGLKPDGSLGNALDVLVRAPTLVSSLRSPSASTVGTVVFAPDALDVSHWMVDPSGQRIGAVIVRFSLARENRSFALLKARILQISVAVACLLTLLLLLLARIYIISPLRSVHAAVRELSTGVRSSIAAPRGRNSLPLAARDEVGDLARGFVSMAEAIERREAAIAAQNSEMRLVLGNVGEGFLVLDARGSIEGQHSSALEAWFGPVPTGQTLWQYLRPHDAALAEWLELTWSNIGSPHMPLALCLLQLPKTFVVEERHYEIEYHPLLDEREQLERMVVVIADVTALRLREQAESEQRELVAVFTALIRDRTGFVSFCEDAAALIKNIAEPSGHESHDLFERLHTLKGNGFLFRLRGFAEACELVETHCAADKRLLTSDDATYLSYAFNTSVSAVAPFIALDRGQTVQLSSSDYAAIARALETGEASETVLSRLLRASAEPADVVFGRFSERMQVLARRLGKCPVRVVCEGNGVRFPKQTFAPLWSATVHVARNIADHGLETAWEREEAGKPAEATVIIRAQIHEGVVIVSFSDDGRGVDWAKVRESAERRGLPVATRADLVAALLGHGFSTLSVKSELSGHGVGLSALVSEVKALEGELSFESELGHGCTLTITLPATLVCS